MTGIPLAGATNTNERRLYALAAQSQHCTAGDLQENAGAGQAASCIRIAASGAVRLRRAWAP